MKRERLRHELGDLALVAAGAIPGALLRWHLERLAEQAGSTLGGAAVGDLIANLLGCLLIGALVAQPPRRARLFLWGAIGFCGSLTTFCSWILELNRAWQHSQALDALALLLLSLVGGLILTTLGYELALRCRRSGSRS